MSGETREVRAQDFRQKLQDLNAALAYIDKLDIAAITDRMNKIETRTDKQDTILNTMLGVCDGVELQFAPPYNVPSTATEGGGYCVRHSSASQLCTTVNAETTVKINGNSVSGQDFQKRYCDK